MLSKTAVRDTILPIGGGPDSKSPIFVPAGTQIMYNLDALHQRKDLWGPDACEFRPERWENRTMLGVNFTQSRFLSDRDFRLTDSIRTSSRSAMGPGIALVVSILNLSAFFKYWDLMQFLNRAVCNH